VVDYDGECGSQKLKKKEFKKGRRKKKQSG
jgi:hypothetical protein